ncbi:hypothetical protein I3843_13G059200 [Carya illinoinensis]|nr:hypothetical protein I3843_13G059200 [Carya illinoinensis]
MAARSRPRPPRKEDFVFPDGYLWISRLNLLFVGCPSHRHSHPLQMATCGSVRPRRKVKFFSFVHFIGVLMYIITIDILYM